MARAGWIAATAGYMLTAALALATPTPADLVAPADFDYYVMTLSWSPGFCDTGGEGKSPEQCDAGSGAGFVVHGLWPDNFNGDDPNCGLQPSYIPGAVLALGARVYPTRGLAIHEWRTHGTCTGLDAAHYFRAVQFARDEFAIPEAFAQAHAEFSLAPEDIVKQFAAANAHLTAESMAVTCVRGELTDVRFCLTKDLRAYARCPQVVRRSCHASSIRVSPAP